MSRVAGGGYTGSDVQLSDQGDHILLDNGIIQVTLSKPGGIVTGIRYGGLDNVLEVLNPETNRGYWDLNWNGTDGKDHFDVIYGTQYQVIDETPDKVEVSFVRPYDPTILMVPLNIDKRFVLLRGNTGFYSYAIYERPAGWSDFNLNQTRITFKLRKDSFQYMAIADNKQRIMPFPDDRLPSRSQQLSYPEAVILINPQNPDLAGEVDDKYQYSCDNRENRVHGWISSDPMVGFWIITPSDEFRNGGIMKQNLTSHVGPTSLSMFHSAHYAGLELCPKFRDGEAWQKVFGPVFIYLNSVPVGSLPFFLWEDAKFQGYQFWTQADVLGVFSIKNVRAGDYNLYGWVPGMLGNYKMENTITVMPGDTLDIGEIVYQPLRDGKTVWDIGIPDRTAAEFFIPDPNPKYVNRLYVNHPERYRQYGLWERYSEIYPDSDLVYTVGQSDWKKDWFFAHVCRISEDGTLQPTTWQVKFTIDKVVQSGAYKLRIACASASNAAIQVRFNDSITTNQPLFDTMQFGKDNAIARHGIHGLYWIFNIDVPPNLLLDGENTLFLTQRKTTSVFNGVMYDYIRFEEPSNDS